MKPSSPHLPLLALLTTGCVDQATSCVAEGTRVLTPEGPRPIESLKVGDLIYSVDEETGEKHSSAIIKIQSATREVGRLHFKGTSLTLTSDHPVYDPTERRYAPAGDWLLGHRARLMLVGDIP